MTDSQRVPYSTRVDANIKTAAVAAVRGMQTIDVDYTLTRLTEDALRAEVDRLAREHHAGEPWPATGAPLRRGRRA